MIVRTSLPVDIGFLVDTDVEPCIVWSELPHGRVVKILELSQPVGFMVYRFDKGIVILEKLCIRDDLLRTGLGTEALTWLINRTRRKSCIGIECVLTEAQALVTGGVPPIVGLLMKFGFESKLTRGKYVFRRPVILQ